MIVKFSFGLGAGALAAFFEFAIVFALIVRFAIELSLSHLSSTRIVVSFLGWTDFVRLDRLRKPRREPPDKSRDLNLNLRFVRFQFDC